jgi:O-antigen/teichoic acid export membrane protein
MLRASVVLTVGRVADYALSFVRNLILAKLLTKADYGLAAVFGMAMTLLEVSGRMGFGMQVIQSRLGDTPRCEASAHGLQFVGCVCSAFLIGGLSIPMARLFGVRSVDNPTAVAQVVSLYEKRGQAREQLATEVRHARRHLQNTFARLLSRLQPGKGSCRD